MPSGPSYSQVTICCSAMRHASMNRMLEPRATKWCSGTKASSLDASFFRHVDLPLFTFPLLKQISLDIISHSFITSAKPPPTPPTQIPLSSAGRLVRNRTPHLTNHVGFFITLLNPSILFNPSLTSSHYYPLHPFATYHPTRQIPLSINVTPGNYLV